MLTEGSWLSTPSTIPPAVATPRIVGVEMAIYDRLSFADWWPRHLASVLELVDELYLRIDPATFDQVEELLLEHQLDAVKQDRIVYQPQFDHYGRFQEDAERQELLAWAIATGADWAVCFDADEVIEPGGGRGLRELLLSPAARQFRLVRVILSYSSHHRPGYVLPRGGFCPWRAFRLDQFDAGYRYQSDEDGLHCGSVPAPGIGAITVPDLRVLHHHATSCEEFMAERAFYSGTTHVEEWGGIDWLYRCDRFGDERLAVPLEQELAGAEERLARLAAGEGLIR